MFFGSSSTRRFTFFAVVKRHIFKKTNSRIWDRELLTSYLFAE